MGHTKPQTLISPVGERYGSSGAWLCVSVFPSIASMTFTENATVLYSEGKTFMI